MKRFYITLLIGLFAFAAKAQEVNLEDIKGQLQKKLKSKPVRVSGGLGLNTVYEYNAGQGQQNFQPFSYIISANVNFNVYGYNLPFTFAYSNKKFQYSNPSFKFNRFAFHPRYKKWTAHIGDVATTFSPYTLSGFQYRGAAVEYNPGNWQVQALYGRFMKAVPEDSLVTPSYKRMGGGAKVVYKNGSKKIGVNIFHASDNKTSIPAPRLTNNQAITPMAGTAVSFEGSYPLIKNLVLEAEYATSALTRNLNYGTDSISQPISFQQKIAGKANVTTDVYHAYKAGLTYTFLQSSVGLNYERVDPLYQTLGGYFFTNDFENMTLSFAQSLWKNKASIAFNGGLQKDDLKHTKESNMKRVVMGVNINMRPTDKMNIGLTYSNFQSYTFLRTGFEKINQVTPYDNLDTLNFTQLSQNAGANINYILEQNKDRLQNLMVTINYAETANKKGDVIKTGDLTRFINGNINYNVSLLPKDMTVAAGFNYSLNYAAQMNSTTMGPTISVGKAFFKKMLRTNYGVAYNSAGSTGRKNNVFNIRAGASTTLAKKHNLNVNAIWQKRTGTTTPPVTYTSITAGYSYSF
jgi:hypothetical protein